MIVECPSCGVKNRIPDPPRIDGEYRCGSCRATLDISLGRMNDRQLRNKIEFWKSRLLDLSNKNRLLNFRPSKSTLQIMMHPAEVLDRLVRRSRQIIMDLEHISTDAANADDLDRRLTRLRRKSRIELTERGVNVLFLVLGFLKWYEADHSDEAHLAPLIMVPVELTRESAGRPYKLRRLDDPLTFNQTLAEKMRVEFDLFMPDLSDLSLRIAGTHLHD